MSLDGFPKWNGFDGSLFDPNSRIPEFRPKAEPRPLSFKSPEEDFCFASLGFDPVACFSIKLSISVMDLFFSIKNEDCFFSVGFALLLEALTLGDVLEEICKFFYEAAFFYFHLSNWISFSLVTSNYEGFAMRCTLKYSLMR